MKIFRVLLFGAMLFSFCHMSLAQTWSEFPVSQSELSKGPWQPLSARQASRDDRWLGLEVRDPRWSPDGEWVYFRWNLDPQPGDIIDLDPWFRVRSDGSSMEQVTNNDWPTVPAVQVQWNPRGTHAAWTRDGILYLWDQNSAHSRAVVGGESPITNVRFINNSNLDFTRESGLYRFDIDAGSVRLIAVARPGVEHTSAREQWLKEQQQDLFKFIQDRNQADETMAQRSVAQGRIPEIKLDSGSELEWVGAAGDGTIVWISRHDPAALKTQYMDFVHESGEATPDSARPKVGAPQASYTLGWLTIASSSGAGDEQGEFSLPEGIGKDVVIHAPSWSPGGASAALQISSLNFQDRWIVDLNWKTKALSILVHDHDDAWLGGPPPVAGYLTPAWFAWLNDQSFAFASERTGWSHLYRYDSGRTRALTQGEWEVRDVQLSKDRTQLLVTASKEHPGDDDLYLMPSRGGRMEQLTQGPGRHSGILSPEGNRIAMLSSDATSLPDLYLKDLLGNSDLRKITRSGTDNFYQYPLVEPRLVSFPHPEDGKPVWGMVYKPTHPNGAGVLHIHGGGYRQFSHRGWSVYGYALHLGTLNYLVGQGYTVLDFDYRGGAGYGRDYRTDIYRDMGNKDITGALPAIDLLVEEEGVDRDRIGVYGISYGGFFTLMALFKHPGIFAAGIANAAVSDWAHYSHLWTGRILNLTTSDEEAYQRSSPINHAAGLQDPLLIVHGLMDDNVQFQDAARLMQKLIELEKNFDVMVYPIERHTIETEASRFDYVKRVDKFFGEHLENKVPR